MMAAVAALLMAAAPLAAQMPAHDTLVPIKRMFGVGDNEFYIGAWCFMHPANAVSWSGALFVNEATGMDSLWKFAGEMGFNILRPQLHGVVHWIDELAESHRFDIPGRDFRFYVHPDQYSRFDFYGVGFGREIRFFPFDSAQSPYYPALFLRHDGESHYNPVEGGAQEIWYTERTARPGDTVASDIRFNVGTCETENRHEFLTEHTIGGRIAGTISIGVSAHLVTDRIVMPDTAPILSIQLWHVIDKGKWFAVKEREGYGGRRATRDIAILCDTVLVRRGELAAGDSGLPADAYREIWRRKSLVTREDGGPGPFHPKQPGEREGIPVIEGEGSLDIDLRVVWLGPEGVALRSVMLRDSLAELILGETMLSRNFRRELRSSTLRLLRGPDTVAGPWRKRIIGVLSGIEQQRMNYAGFVGISEFLRKNFNWHGDSLSAHTEDAATFHFHHLARPDGAFPEIGIGIEVGVEGALELPYELAPQIAEHNGARFREAYTRRTPTLLVPRPDAIERYEDMMQRGTFTRFVPGVNCYPYHTGTAHRLGMAAEVSRRTGRRMIPVVFCMGGGIERAFDVQGNLETFLSRVPEGSELRAVVMMGLCYGAHGILWTQLGSDMNLLRPLAGRPDLWFGGTDSWGAGGPRLGDTLVDLADTLRLTGTADTITRAAIPNVWIGHRSRTREIRELNRWLAAIGPELTRLRWRDSYSIYYTTPTPGLRRDTGHRPIAPGEIVTGVHARALHAAWPASVADDPLHRTFVELGLFEPLPGFRGALRDSMNDTLHLFLVNRRTFERPIDVDPGSARGRLMDTLAESRRIAVDLRRLFPASVERLRIREVRPDVAPIPLAGERVGLDTVIADGGSFSIDLRPGGGALIEITRLPVELFGEMLVAHGSIASRRVIPVSGSHDLRELAFPAAPLDPLRELRPMERPALGPRSVITTHRLP